MEGIENLVDLAIYLVDKIRELRINMDIYDTVGELVEEFWKKQKISSTEVEELYVSTLVVDRYGYDTDLKERAYRMIPGEYKALIDEFLRGRGNLSFNTI